MEEQIAEKMSDAMREVSVAEFFEKNRHLLGYENSTKALLTIVKELLDNSVEYNEPVLVRVNGETKLVKIGEFIDGAMKSSGCVEAKGDAESGAIKNCEVLAYDDKNFKMSFQKASMVHRHPLRDKLYEITTAQGRKTTITGSHSVFGLKDGVVKALEVKELKEGDYIAVPRNKFDLCGGVEEIDLRTRLKELPKDLRNRLVIHGVSHMFNDLPRDWKRFDYIPYDYFEKSGLEIPAAATISMKQEKTALPVLLKVKPSLLRLLGYYAAEGTCYDSWVTLSFGSHEIGLIEDAERCIMDSFGGKMGFSRIFAHPTAITVKIHSAILAFLFKNILKTGSKAVNKKVPDIAFNVPEGMQKEFLYGYINGDGYVQNNRITVATVSDSLSVGLQYLFGLNGLAYSTRDVDVREREFPKGYKSVCKRVHYIYVYSPDASRQRNSPLSWIPLEESGMRSVIKELNPLNSYNNPHYKFCDLRDSFTISSAMSDLEEAVAYKRGQMTTLLQTRIDYLTTLLKGDIGFLKIKEIRVVESDSKYVYDFSVPGYEKFLGGRGPIFLHNSLDACNEAGILPDIKVTIKQLSEDRFKIMTEDNGPGITDQKIPFAFGKLLYGSKFYRLRQSRGIQGLGGHGAVLYSQLTTGKPSKVTSSVGKDIHSFDLMINVTKNEPHIIKHDVMKNPDKWHGVKIEMEVEGRYVEGKQSIAEYIRQSHMSNPYAKITFVNPNGKVEYKRLLEQTPVQPKEIRPHPHGVEIGVLRRMMHTTKARNLVGFLTGDFSRVGRGTALQMLKAANLDSNKKPLETTHDEIEKLHKAMQAAKLIAPPTDCLSPMGENLLSEGLKKDSGAEFVVAVTRPPSVYRGNPFLVEVSMGYGGTLPADQGAQLFRFANKVPLLYHQSDCVTSDAVTGVDFRRYGFSQPSGSLPVGPLAILIHFASVWVPFTSEGKQAIANYPEIEKEIKLALQDAGRKLAIYVRQKAKKHDAQLRRELFERYIPEVSKALSKLTDKDEKVIKEKLEKITKKSLSVVADENGAKEA